MKNKLQKISLLFVSLTLGSIALSPKFNLSFSIISSEIAYAQNNTKIEADRLREEGKQLYDRGQFVQASEILERAMKLYKEINDEESYKEVLGQVYFLYYQTGAFDKLNSLMPEYSRVNGYDDEIESDFNEGKTDTELNPEVERLISSGFFLVEKEDYSSARNYFNQALSKAQEINGELEQIAVLTEIGKSYLYEGNYHSAIATFKLADNISAKRYPGIENGFEAYGDIHSESFGSLYREMISYYIPFLQLFGEAYLQNNQPTKALIYFEKAEAITTQIKNQYKELAYIFGENFFTSSIITTDSNLYLSRANYSLENYQKALDYANKAIAKAEALRKENPQIYNAPFYGVRTNEVGDGQGYALAGIALEKLGKLDQAKENLKKAVQIFEYTRNKSTFKADINHNLKLFNNQVRAASLLQRVLIAQNKPEEALAAAEWGRGKLLVESATATKLSETSLEDKVNAYVDSEYGSRNLCQELKNSIPEFNPPPQVDKPIATVPEVSISQARRPEDDINTSSSPEEIMKKVFPLQYYYQQQIANCENEVSIEEIRQATLENARKNPEQFEQRFSEQLIINPTINITSNTKSLNVEQLKQIAQSHQATIVEYSFISDSTYFHGSSSNDSSRNVFSGEKQTLLIWVIKPTGEIKFHKVDLQTQGIDIEQLIANTRQTMGLGRNLKASPKPGFEGTTNIPRNSSGIQATEQLKQLYQLLIAPIAEFLPTNPEEQVIFVPHEELFIVPFAALIDKSGKYLIENHTITTSPSVQTLAITNQKKHKTHKNQKAVVVGNPTMPLVPQPNNQSPQQLDNLPGAEAEGKEIAQLLNTQLLTGNQATKDRVLEELPQAQFIHLATHGLLDDYTGFGIPGTIALAPTGSDNGFLSASVIQEMNLSAELAVLSACDTGRGDISGDGVVGLSRSLIIAGVPSVVVSLWSVPDAPTADLMVKFYRNFTVGGLNKAQALRQAMLSIKQQNPDPINWAAFTLIGEN